MPPGPGPLTIATPDGQDVGPPGVRLDLSGDGYDGCSTAYFFFDGVRIGTVRPSAAGVVNADRLYVPGDAKPGTHTITSSCSPSGRPVRASGTFQVVEADIHRPALATSLPRPDQISLDPQRILASGLAAALIILLFAFPFQLFNSTVDANYDEIRGWFRLPARAVEGMTRAHRTVTFFGCSALGAVILGFLSPDFGLNLNSAVLAVGYTAGMIVMSLGFGVPTYLALRRRTGEWGKLNFLPGTLLVSAVLVLLSRLLNFQPGYFYGALAGFAFAAALPAKAQGRLTAANWMWALALSLGAWFLSVPVADAAAKPDPSVLWVALEACLVLTFLWGLEGLAVAMLPMRFLDGERVREWSRVVWSVLLFLGVFSVVHVLLSPHSGYLTHTDKEVTIGVLALFLGFGALSVALWAYFRYRPRRHAPEEALTQ